MKGLGGRGIKLIRSKFVLFLYDMIDFRAEVGLGLYSHSTEDINAC